MTNLAYRFSEDSQESYLVVLNSQYANEASIIFKESTKCVDGIGGFAWNGSLIMSYLLQGLTLSISVINDGKPLHVHEIGCGSAVPSILLSVNNYDECKQFKFSSSDREIDLAVLNMNLVSKQISQEIRNKAFPLDWGCGHAGLSEKAIIDFGGVVDILIGCEIACLRLQQEKLLKSVDQLVGPESLIFLSFDGEPPSSADKRNGVKWASLGEREMHLKLTHLGYACAVIFTGCIVWEPQSLSQIDEDQRLRLQDVMSHFYNGGEFRCFFDTIIKFSYAHFADSTICFTMFN